MGDDCATITLYNWWPVARVLCQPPYLCLRDPEAGCKLGSFGQGKVLGALEPPLQLLDLQRRVNAPWLPDLLPLSIDSSDQLAVLYNCVACK